MNAPDQWCPKWLREALCAQETHIPRTGTHLESVTREAFRALFSALDSHRPLRSDGKHGDLHTDTCGCEDRDTCPNDDLRCSCAVGKGHRSKP